MSLKLFPAYCLTLVFIAWLMLLSLALQDQTRRQNSLEEAFDAPLHEHSRLLEQQFQYAYDSLDRLHDDVLQLGRNQPANKSDIGELSQTIKQQLRAHPKQYAHFMAFGTKEANTWFNTKSSPLLFIVHKQESYADAPAAYNHPDNMRIESIRNVAFTRSAGEDWFYSAKETRESMFVGDFENRYTREWVLTFVRGVYLQDNFQGVVGVYVRLADIVRELEGWRRDNTGGLLLINHQTGKLLTSTGTLIGETIALQPDVNSSNDFIGRHERGRTNLYKNAALRAIDWQTLLETPDQHYIKVEGRDSETYRLSTLRIPETPLTLLLYQQNSELPFAGLPGYFLYASLALLVLSLGLIWWFIQGMLHPINKLLAVNEEFSDAAAIKMSRFIPKEFHYLRDKMVGISTLYQQLEEKTYEVQIQMQDLHTQMNTHIQGISEKEQALQDATQRHQQTEAQVHQFRTHLKQARVDIQKLKAYAQKTLVALQQSKARTQAAEQAKYQFLANMSHELRTPLNAIVGYTEILQEDAEEAGMEMMKPDLQKILGASYHLLELINNLFDLSNLYMHRIELFPERFDVMPMLEDVMATMQPLIEQQGNILKLEVEEALGSMRNDLPKVRQNLMHLLGNASKFSEHGTITLSAHREKQEGMEWVIFTVSDQGIGMAPEQTNNIFELFADENQSRHRSTGFSLALVKQFCQLMGGDIQVNSELGKGSEFTMRLPIEMQALASAAA